MVVGSPIKLNLVPSGIMPVVYINETDEGFEKEFLIYNEHVLFIIPANVSATIRGTKGDHRGVAESATITAGTNRVRVTVTEQMTAVAGPNIYELRFVDTDGMKVGTINFIMMVEKAALDADTVISDSDIAYADQVLDQLQSVAAFKNQLDNTDWHFVNVKFYGAKGDGVTDDSAAIQAAIAALPIENGVLFFPHGLYIHGDGTTTGESYTSDGTPYGYIIDSNHPATIGRDIRLKFDGLKNVTILGDGAEIRSNDGNGECLHNAIFWFVNCDGVTVDGITVNGRREERGLHLNDMGTNGANMRYNIYVGGCKNVLIKNVKSINSAMDGIYFGPRIESGTTIRGENYTAENCDCSNAHRNCVSVANVKKAAIENCILNYAATHGATWHGTAPGFGIDVEADGGEAYPSEDIVITKCQAIGDQGYDGIGVAYGSINVIVSECYTDKNVESSGDARNSRNVNFYRNKIKNAFLRMRCSGIAQGNIVDIDGSVAEDESTYSMFISDVDTSAPVIFENNMLIADPTTIPSGVKTRFGITVNNSNAIFRNNTVVNPSWGYSGTPLTFDKAKEVVGNSFIQTYIPTGYNAGFSGFAESTVNDLNASGIFADNHFYGFTLNNRGASEYNNAPATAVTKTFGLLLATPSSKKLKISTPSKATAKIRFIDGQNESIVILQKGFSAVSVYETSGNHFINVYRNNNYELFVTNTAPGFLGVVIELTQNTLADGNINVNSVTDIVSLDTTTDVSTLTAISAQTAKEMVVYGEYTGTTNTSGTINLPWNYTACKGIMSATCRTSTYLMIPFHNTGNGTWAVKVFNTSMQPVANTEVKVSYTAVF